MTTYTNITGISRAVMKDNAQETLANYDGNARPGELVVNLVVDPPALYVGNNSGQLTAITSGGGAGLPLANGTSNFDIAATDGNATITVDGLSTWTFDDTGDLTIPGDIFGAGVDALVVQNVVGGDAYLELPVDPDADPVFLSNDSANGIVNIRTNGTVVWEFDNTGVLTAPGNISTDGYISAGNIGVSTTVTTQTLVTDPGPLSGLTLAWGARGFINDGNLVAAGNFGAQVGGGGGNSVPVWSDGTNWYIG